MNIIDIIVLIIMGISMVAGSYNGLITSAMHTISFFLSWVISVFLYPVITSMILSTFPKLMNVITLYTDGRALIPDVEDRLASIKNFSPEKIGTIVETANLPEPFGRILVSDFSQSLEGIKTVGEYFDSTMAMVIINICSFIILFLLVKLLFMIIVSVTKAVANLPVLRKFDALAGAGFGIVRGVFILYLVFALIPILLVLAPTDIMSEFLDGSKYANFFQNTNIFTNFVRGR
ncbi:MAG TPA: CvpA family protein [Clostridiales bacterium]|nr:CvpA family protein [Clostridiales bacterium]